MSRKALWLWFCAALLALALAVTGVAVADEADDGDSATSAAICVQEEKYNSYETLSSGARSYGIWLNADYTGDDTPEWCVEQTAGPSVQNFYVDSASGNKARFFYRISSAVDEVEYSFDVTAAWREGGQDYVCLFHITKTYMYDDTTSPVNIPSEIVLDLKESREYTIAFADYDRVEGEAFHLSAAGSEGLGYDYDSNTGHVRLFEYKAGFYVFRFDLRQGDHYAANRQIIVKVKDKDGSVPTPEIDLYTYDHIRPTWDGALMTTSESGFQLTSDVGYVLFTNYAEITGLYGQEPVWTFEQLSGPDLDLSTRQYADKSQLYFCMSNPPGSSCDVEVQVTVTCGEASSSTSFTVTFVDVGEPEGFDFPSEIDICQGEEIVITGAILPTGWLDELEQDDGYLYFIQTTGSTQGLTVTKPTSNQVRIEGLNPGIYNYRVDYTQNNVHYSRSVPVTVRDEDGNYPQIQLTFADWTDTDVTAIIAPVDAEIGCRSDIFCWELDKTAYDYFAQQGYDVSWSVRQISGPDILYGKGLNGRALWFILAEAPTEPCDAVFRATAIMGESICEHDVTVHFIDGELPTGTTLPSEITLMAGESVDLPVYLTSDSGYYGQSYWYEGTWNEQSIALLDRVDDNTMRITGLNPGVHFTTIMIRGDNCILAEHNLTVRVTDENGNVPESLTFDSWSIEDKSLIIGPLAWDVEAGQAYAEHWLFSARLTDACYAAYVNQYGEPVWTLTQTSGPAIDVYTSDEGSYLYASLNEFPAEPCVATFHVTASMGSVTGEADITVTFVKEDLPTGCTLPESITLKAGESVEVEGQFITDNPYWDSTWFSAWSSDENVLYIQRVNDNKAIFTGVNPGSMTIYAEVYQDNIHCRRPIIINVTDENGNVPDVDIDPYSYSDEYTYYFWPGAQPLAANAEQPEDVVTLSMYLYGVGINNDGALSARYGGAPEWRVETVSGPETSWTMSDWAVGGSYYSAALDAVPEQAGTAVVNVICEWGGQTASVTKTLHFVEIEPLTGANVPDEVTLNVGETTAFDWHFIPDSDEFETDVSTYNLFQINPIFESVDTVGPVLKGLKAGTVTGQISLYGNNVFYTKTITITVVDDRPEPARLTLPAGLTAIEQEAFAGTAVQSVTLPIGCERIESRAFADCADLLQVEIPASVTSIAADAFDGSGSVVIIAPAGSVAAQFAAAHGIAWQED